MQPRWSGGLPRKGSQPKQYYFGLWIIRLDHQPAMIFIVIRISQILFFFCLSWAVRKDKRKNQPMDESLQQK